MARRVTFSLLIAGGLLFLSGATPSVVAQEKPPAKPVASPATVERHASAGLAGLHIYSTFGCLGLAADLFACKQYDAAKVQQIAGDVGKTSELAIEMLKSARTAAGKGADDIPYEDLIQCYFLLDREARLLADAAKAGDKESLQRFQQAREETWDKVAAVLGIENARATSGKSLPETKPAPELKPQGERGQP